MAAPHTALLLLLLQCLLLLQRCRGSHFRGGIIMVRPLGNGTSPDQIEISFQISYRRSHGEGGYCSQSTISSKQLLGGVRIKQLACQQGCVGNISPMQYYCTDFSVEEDWTFGERRLLHDFSAAAEQVTIGYADEAWIRPFSGFWNLTASFSLTPRRDTGRINSTPRALTSPVIRLQDKCNHTVKISVSDPDNDMVRCRWAVDTECADICDSFPGAELDPETCSFHYTYTEGNTLRAAAIMLEDFLPGSDNPISSVGLQFLIEFFSSSGPCSSKPLFVPPTFAQGSCVAIPVGATLTTKIIAFSGRDTSSIKEIQTVSPPGTVKSELLQDPDTPNQYIEITWTPEPDQYGLVHSLCYTAVTTDGVTGDQTCIQFLAGYDPPAVEANSQSDNGNVVNPHTHIWTIRFDKPVKRPQKKALLTFHSYTDEAQVYQIDASSSDEISFPSTQSISINPNFEFEEEVKYFILLNRGVVVGLDGCGPSNQPILEKDFWTFTTKDVTPPVVTFDNPPIRSNESIRVNWVSNEPIDQINCQLQLGSRIQNVDCSKESWEAVGLEAGSYKLVVNVFDDEGNEGQYFHIFEVDTTAPNVFLTKSPPLLTNQNSPEFWFTCDEVDKKCRFDCSFREVGQSMVDSTFPCNEGKFTTPLLENDKDYSFSVRAVDIVGNMGQFFHYMWSTDFTAPTLSDIKDTSSDCEADLNPETNGRPTAQDNRGPDPVVTYTDEMLECKTIRTWEAKDKAGNMASRNQTIILDFQPSVVGLTDIIIACDSTESGIQVSDTTASEHNPCSRPLTLTHTDSVSSFSCPSTFIRTWTIQDGCSGTNVNFVQTVTLQDVCPPYACGRNFSQPRGICSLGKCSCTKPWEGESCHVILIEPNVGPVADATLQEGEDYEVQPVLTEGTPPLTWYLVSRPEGMWVDITTGLVKWTSVKAGTYTVILEVENQASIKSVQWTVTGLTSYSVNLAPVSPSDFPNPTPVSVQGQVTFDQGSILEQKTGGVAPISIDIRDKMATRTFTTNSASDGTFSILFSPSATEHSSYSALAYHPSVDPSSLPAQVSWNVLGMSVEPSSIRLPGEAVSGFSKVFKNIAILTNDGPAELANVNVEVSLGGLYRWVKFNVLLDGQEDTVLLSPGESANISVEVETSRPIVALIPIVITTTQGSFLRFNANLEIKQTLPEFLLDPVTIEAQVLRGTTANFVLNVTNIGKTSATSVSVQIPENAFVSLLGFGTDTEIGNGINLDVDESAKVEILVKIPEDQPIGEIKGSFVIFSEELSKSVPFTFYVTSSATVDLTITVEDEYTYFAESNPLVSNADIKLDNYRSDVHLLGSTKDGNGKVTFKDVPEDRYELIVSAPQHANTKKIILVTFSDKDITVFIERSAVTYRFTVTPTEFRDSYKITLEADFETYVPIPVVTVEPSELDLVALETGLINTIQFNITNHGLIRADDLGFQFPKNHPVLSFSTDIDLSSIDARTSIIVPVTVTRRTRVKRAASCSFSMAFRYSYVCSDKIVKSVPIILAGSYSGDCGWLPCCGGGGGGGSFGSISYVSGATSPCNKCLGSAIKCLMKFVPSIPGSDCIPLIKAGDGGDLNGLLNPIDWIKCLSSLGFPGKGKGNGNGQNTGGRSTGGGSGSRSQGQQGSGRKRRKRFVPAALGAFAAASKAISLFEDAQFWFNCATDLYKNCLPGQDSSGRRRKRDVNDVIQGISESLLPIHVSMLLAAEVLGSEKWIEVGDEEWERNIFRPTLDDNSDLGILISDPELQAISSSRIPEGVTLDDVVKMVERINNTITSWNSGQLEPNDGENVVSHARVKEMFDIIYTFDENAKSKGFSSYIEAYNFAAAEMNKVEKIEEREGVCAVVRLRIEQEASLTREAFLAQLDLENKESSALTDITLSLSILDESTGEPSAHLFSIGKPEFSGGLVYTGTSVTLDNVADGTMKWLIVPYTEAAPTADKLYLVGGDLAYTLAGEKVTIPMLPTPITVKPDPSLIVHYFWDRYVISDDPFTDELEPAVPFTLGVAVKNAGYGIAHDMQIASAQPEIISNEKGLLVDFKIIGASIGEKAMSPSLTVKFGDIGPMVTMVARWWLVSSLQGEFKNYSATFENVNPLGDPKLSVLDELKIHQLIRNVRLSQLEEDDGVLDFLVNDLKDLYTYPEGVFSSSSLVRYNVSTGEIENVQIEHQENVIIMQLTTMTQNVGLVYFRYTDIGKEIHRNAQLSRVIRIDGAGGDEFVFPVENAWLTVAQTKDKTVQLHLLDELNRAGTVEYTVHLCLEDCVQTNTTNGPQPIPHEVVFKDLYAIRTNFTIPEEKTTPSVEFTTAGVTTTENIETTKETQETGRGSLTVPLMKVLSWSIALLVIWSENVHFGT